MARKPALLAVGSVLVAGGLLGYWWFAYGQDKAASVDAPAKTRVQQDTGVEYRTMELALGGQMYILDIADTEAKYTLGLGKRADIPPDGGMAFVYGGPGTRCFWMKDMNFPIDIIWLDARKRVVHIEAEVSPDTYPKTFCPAGLAQYVVELYPGAAKTAALKVGDEVNFEL